MISPRLLANLVPTLTAVPTPCASAVVVGIATFAERCSSISVVVHGPSGARIWDKASLILVPYNPGGGWQQELERGIDVGQLLRELQVILLLLLGTKQQTTEPRTKRLRLNYAYRVDQSCPKVPPSCHGATTARERRRDIPLLWLDQNRGA